MYVFLYGMFYYYFYLHVAAGIPNAIYFANLVLVVLMYALAAGSVGFAAAWVFVLKIYTTIKVD